MSTPRVVVTGAEAFELRRLLLLREQLAVDISDWVKTFKTDHAGLACLLEQQKDIEFKITVLLSVYCSYEGSF